MSAREPRDMRVKVTESAPFWISFGGLTKVGQLEMCEQNL